MKSSVFFIAIVSSVVLLPACKSDEQSTGDSKNDLVKKAKIEVDTTDVFVSEEYDFMLPQPFALVSSFENIDMEYNSMYMNAPENTAKYTTEGEKLLNFGVYSTDLVYSIIHEQPQASMKYFDAVRTMADKIGMGSIFEQESLADSIEKNIANRDEMEFLLIDVHERSQEYLENNEMRLLAAIQFAGAWTEGMYLATRNAEKADITEISASIHDHMSLSKNVIDGLEAYKDRGEDLDQVLNKIKSVKKDYENLESIKDLKGLPVFSTEELEMIKTSFEELRTLITG